MTGKKRKKTKKRGFFSIFPAPFCQLLIFSIYPDSPDTELVDKDCLQIWSHSDHKLLSYRGDSFEFVISGRTHLKYNSLITITRRKYSWNMRLLENKIFKKSKILHINSLKSIWFHIIYRKEYTVKNVQCEWCEKFWIVF